MPIPQINWLDYPIPWLNTRDQRGKTIEQSSQIFYLHFLLKLFTTPRSPFWWSCLCQQLVESVGWRRERRCNINKYSSWTYEGLNERYVECAPVYCYRGLREGEMDQQWCNPVSPYLLLLLTSNKLESYKTVWLRPWLPSVNCPVEVSSDISKRP